MISVKALIISNINNVRGIDHTRWEMSASQTSSPDVCRIRIKNEFMKNGRRERTSDRMVGFSLIFKMSKIGIIRLERIVISEQHRNNAVLKKESLEDLSLMFKDLIKLKGKG